jgi:hypothetical protein
MTRRNASIEKNESEATSVRPKRIAVGLRPKLSVEGKDPNYEYRIVNDTPGRIAMFQNSGWELCTNDEVNTGNFRADQAAELGSLAYHIVDGGNGLKGYVLKIHKDWYKQFMDEYESEVRKSEETLQPNSNDGEYGGIKIDRSGRRV